MAEAVFAHKVKAAGLSEWIEADSAGTGSWHTGDPPHRGTTELLSRKQIEYFHIARTIEPSDLNAFDYVLTMDNENLRSVKVIGTGTAVVRPFLEYAPALGIREVPDPWFDGKFDRVYDLVAAASDGLLNEIKSKYFETTKNTT